MDFKSCHLKHIKIEILYGQALRLRRICESEEIFERLGELRRYLLKRGFRSEVIDGQSQKASGASRTALLYHGSKSKCEIEDRVPLVSDHHPALSGIGKKILELIPILLASEDMKQIFHEASLVSFRRQKHL